MISNLELKQFRGLEHVRFENLGRANLIIGGNNTGKTSILEALVLLLGGYTQVSKLPETFREQPSNTRADNYWPYIFKGSSDAAFQLSTNDCQINTTSDGNGTVFNRSSNLQPGSTILMNLQGGSVNFSNFEAREIISILTTKHGDPSEISELYNQIAPLNPDNELKLEELLRKAIDPRLRRLRYAKPQGTSTHLVYVDFGDGSMLPMT